MTDTAPAKTTVTITVDGKPVEANPGELVIAAAERAGTYIPRFCWHPRMSPVGMCRQCLVEQEGPRGKMLVVSCMTPVAEGMVIHTASDTVRKAQEGVLEFLLVNHPLDCPVCDKGGECPLQDQAFSHGPGESRFVEEKRHYAKPIPISDLVMLDRERCILCDRCTRFAKEVAGDPLIHFTHRGNQTQVLTFPDEPFSSYFSGNTVQICPVGALTASPYRFKARPWDLDQVESTCTSCSVGCRIVVQASRDELLRYQGSDIDSVNWSWLCDKGRFGFEAVNSEQRLSGPLVRRGDSLESTSWSVAIDAAATAIRTAIAEHGPQGVAVLGGARGTNEDALAWSRLAAEVIGTTNTDCQLGDGLPAELVLGLPRATIDQAAGAATVLLLAPDLKEELPVLYLRLRDAAEKRRTRIIELSPKATGLSPYAFARLAYRPGEEAVAVRALLGNGSAAAAGLDEATVTSVREQLAKGPVVVVLGRSSLSSSDAFVTEAAVTLHQGLPEASFLTVLRRGNVFGAIDMGLAPGLAPGRRSGASGMDARQILEAAASGRIGALVLLGADPLADFPDSDLAARALAGAGAVIAVDTHPTDSVRRAHVVLAASAFGEKGGSTTNLEGRVSIVSQKVNAHGTSRADWIIAAELALSLGGDLGYSGAADVWADVVATAYPGLTADQLRGEGALVPGSSVSVPAASTTEVPAADSYALRLVVSRELYDAGITTAASASMAGLPRGASLHLNGYDFDRIAPTGDSVKVSSPRTSLVLRAVRDDAVARGCAWVAHHQPDVPVGGLIDASRSVVDVRVETL